MVDIGIEWSYELDWSGRVIKCPSVNQEDYSSNNVPYVVYCPSCNEDLYNWGEE